MKIQCKNCGQWVDDAQHFCPNCGEPLDQPISRNVQEAKIQSKPNNHQTLIIVVAIAAAAVVALAAYFFVFKKQTAVSSAKSKSTVTQSQSAKDSNSVSKTNEIFSAGGSSVYTTGPEAVLERYIRHWGTAVSEGDYSLVGDYILANSQMANAQENFIANHRDQVFQEEFVQAQIVENTKLSADKYQITTDETYDVTTENYTDRRISQEVQYTVVKTSDGEWLLSTVKKLSGDSID
ncbi:MAG: zinc ribbon domain-containing protein [Pseudoramibacter sp.]